MKVIRYGNEKSENILIQMIGMHEIPFLENEVKLIREYSGTEDFQLHAVKVDDWNRELSPWVAPAAFGDEDFGGQGWTTLKSLMDYIENEIYGEREEYYPHLHLGGYSLAGLFALWASYQTYKFEGVAAVSPSVWYPKFEDYISSNDIMASRVYLSLGKKEAATRNEMMSQVADIIQRVRDELESEIKVTLEWNEGNHFKDPDVRMAKGFAWILNEL